MNCRLSSNGWAWADRRTRGRTGEAMRHRLSDLAAPENIYTVQIGSAIGTHVGPGAPIGRLLGAGDLHMVSRAIPGSLAMAVPHGALHVMTIMRTTLGIKWVCPDCLRVLCCAERSYPGRLGWT